MRTLRISLLLVCLALLAACAGAPQAGPEPTASLPAPPEATATAAPSVTAEATATTAPAPTALPPTATIPPATTTPGGGAGEPMTAFCPEIARPALILFVPGEKYVVVDPASGQSCDLPFPDPLPGILQVADGKLYYHVEEGDNLVVRRLSPDGTAETLAFTAVDKVERSVHLSFAVSPDGRSIAWSAAGSKADDPSVVVSDLWVAEIATGQVTAHLTDFTGEGEGPHSLVPVRFDNAAATLFYTRAPVSIGGAWNSFVGRYENLFSTPAAGGAVTTIFDCSQLGLFMCLGDFYLLEGRPATIVYVDDQAREVVVLNDQGQAINTLPVDAEYAGYPTLGPTAELVFYSADLADDFPRPERAALHRVAPPTAPDEVVVSDPHILLPQRFVGDTRVVVGYAADDGTWGNAIVDLGTGALRPLSEWPNAMVVGVLDATTP